MAWKDGRNHVAHLVLPSGPTRAPISNDFAGSNGVSFSMSAGGDSHWFVGSTWLPSEKERFKRRKETEWIGEVRWDTK